MGGFLGVGGNGPDKQKESAAQANLGSIFSQGVGTSADTLATGKAQQAQGTTSLDNASQYWKNLLTAGRTQTAENSAPAVNAAVAGENAQRTQGAQFGSARSGGTAADNQKAATNTQSNINNIINENLVGGKAAGAKGLEDIGGTELAAGSDSIKNALAQLGLGTQAETSVLDSAAGDRAGVRQAQTEIWSKVIGSLL